MRYGVYIGDIQNRFSLFNPVFVLNLFLVVPRLEDNFRWKRSQSTTGVTRRGKPSLVMGGREGE